MFMDWDKRHIHSLYLSYAPFSCPSPFNSIYINFLPPSPSPTNVASSHIFSPLHAPAPCYQIPPSLSSSCLSAQPPTCHLYLRAMGHSCRISVTSMHTYTQAHTHMWLSHAASPDYNQWGLSCWSGRLSSGGWRDQSVLQGNDRVCLFHACVSEF